MKMDRRRVFVGFYEIVEDIYIFDRIIKACIYVYVTSFIISVLIFLKKVENQEILGHHSFTIKCSNRWPASN